MEKKCNKCGEVKCLDEFNNDKYRKDGKDFKCKICYKIYRNRNKKKYNQSNKKWRENNREQINESAKEIRENNKKHKNQNISTLEFIKLFHENNKLKKCTKCEDVKSFDEFCKDKYKKSGKSPRCKMCVNLYAKKNKEKIKEYKKTYDQINKIKISEKKKEYREKNKGIINLQNKKYNFNNKEYHKNYYALNKEDIIKNASLNRKNRINIDPLFKLIIGIRHNVANSLKAKGYSKKTKTYNMLKCEYPLFMEWLNGLASNGYTYGIGNLHLDHVVPISLSKTEDEAILLCHYSNYQLLSATDNIVKGNRYVNPLNLARVLEHHPNPDKIREIHARL